MLSRALLSEIPSSIEKETLYNDIKNQKILVVDDAALNRELITSYLESGGYTTIQVADDGKRALELVDSFAPDLIILDLIMPGISGFEVIKSIRSQKGLLNIPIIVQTAISDPEQRVEAWLGGANDVITKPIHRLELLSRVKVQLKTNILIQKLEHYHEAAEADIKQALELQRSLLPSSDLIKTLENKHKISLKSLFKPSRFLSGDIWGAIDISDTQMGVWICDFSGKGIKAALNTFRIHTILQEYKHCADEPSELL
ncbi:MAG TPA: response regulator, partial [Alphaproteobacteria bacterium]|nr:response regulator [Alphaproteobacteria bacterium]